jgi:hypothetical protein
VTSGSIRSANSAANAGERLHARLAWLMRIPASRSSTTVLIEMSLPSTERQNRPNAPAFGSSRSQSRNLRIPSAFPQRRTVGPPFHSTKCADRSVIRTSFCIVGCVARSDTHRDRCLQVMGIACAPPSYVITSPLPAGRSARSRAGYQNRAWRGCRASSRIAAARCGTDRRRRVSAPHPSASSGC